MISINQALSALAGGEISSDAIRVAVRHGRNDAVKAAVEGRDSASLLHVWPTLRAAGLLPRIEANRRSNGGMWAYGPVTYRD